MRTLTQAHKDAMQAGRAAAKTETAHILIESLTQSELEESKTATRYLPSAKTAFLKAFSGKSKSAAIKAKCIQCAAYQRSEVTNCQVTACALFRYRPFRGGVDEPESET